MNEVIRSLYDRKSVCVFKAIIYRIRKEKF